MPSSVAETIQYQAALQGKMFMAGSGVLTLALLSYLRATISNPAGSGKLMMIHQIDVFSAASAGFAHLFTNPSIGLPTTSARPILNCNIDGANAPSIGIVKADLVSTISGTALNGGTGFDSGLDVAIGPSTYSPITLPPIILRPGQMLGMGATIAAGVNLSLTIRWNEQPGT